MYARVERRRDDHHITAVSRNYYAHCIVYVRLFAHVVSYARSHRYRVHAASIHSPPVVFSRSLRVVSSRRLFFYPVRGVSAHTRTVTKVIIDITPTAVRNERRRSVPGVDHGAVRRVMCYSGRTTRDGETVILYYTRYIHDGGLGIRMCTIPYDIKRAARGDCGFFFSPVVLHTSHARKSERYIYNI